MCAALKTVGFSPPGKQEHDGGEREVNFLFQKKKKTRHDVWISSESIS